MDIRRRDFLKLFGGLSGGAVLVNYGLDPMFAVPKNVIERATFGPRVETWKNTICTLCPGGCGLRVRLINDVPVTLKGNPLSPVNKGGLCPLGLSSIHSLYHPDRLGGPVKRTGAPGSGSWSSVSWDDALSTVGGRLKDLRSAGAPHQLAILGGDESALMKDHINRFAQSYGTPNYCDVSSSASKRTGYILTQGDGRTPAPDILNARLVMSFGANILEDGPSPVHFTKLYSQHDLQNTKYIHIDSRMNRTAANADLWVPIRPGTYGALALGIAYVLIREELYDAGFVARSCSGFEDWRDARGTNHMGFRSLVLSEYYPEKVQEITGIPSARILELGRELGNTRPSVVLCDHAALDHTNGTMSLMAVNALNALLGNYDKEGGVFLVDEPPLASFGRVPADAVSRQGVSQPSLGREPDASVQFSGFSMETFISHMEKKDPYQIDTLIILGGNPLFQTVHQRSFARALEHIPLVVYVGSMMNETSEYAHLVLPDHLFLEQRKMVTNVEGVGFTFAGIQQPVIPPMYDTRHMGDLFIDLAGRCDGAPAKAYSYATFEEGVQQAARGLFESESGAITAEGTGRQWLEFLRQKGWRIDRYATFDEFWERITTYAGWWNPMRSRSRGPIFPTPSRRFEFQSGALRSAVQSSIRATSRSEEDILKAFGISAGGDTAYMAHYEAVSGDQNYPLQLISFRRLPVGDGRGASLPMMQELFGHAAGRHWESWAEINTETARQLEIADGEWIRVLSATGELRIRSKISEGVSPGVIAIPFGLGHTSGDRYARGYGVHPHVLASGLHDRLSGREASHATRVRVLPA